MRFWVDIDNAPHVLVLKPLIEELTRRGHRVEITARDFGQTIPLLRMYGIPFMRVGRHAGKNKAKKYLSLLTRSISLLFYALGKRFDLVFSHGTRAAFLPARLLGIPLIVLCDYEFTTLPRFMARWITLQLFPDVIPREIYIAHGIDPKRLCGYPGLKEDLYVHNAAPDPSFIDENGMDPCKVIVIVRPPATMAHYAVPRSEAFFYQILDFLCAQPQAQILLLPRTQDQGREIQAYKERHRCERLFISRRPHDGPGMMRCADIVVSGGGTMNREAATLGVPVYSIYQGPIGAVDGHLIRTGKLTHLAAMDMVEKIPLVKVARQSVQHDGAQAETVRSFIVERIVECAGRAAE